MANTLTSPNMNLPVPVVGVDPTPTWGTDLNNCLTLIDAHNHAAGYGVQITPGGLNINADLPMGNNSLTNTKTLAFFTQLSDPSTLGALYYKGVDLYFNDGSSNHIRMTQSGSVAGATGTITGLPTGTASASYNAGTFVFQSATNTAANIDGQSFILRNSTASSNGLTLSPPNAMGSNYALTLPPVPAQTNVMTLTSGGAMGSITYDAVGQAMTLTGANAIGVTMTATGANAVAATRTRTVGASSLGIGGVATNGSSSTFSTTSIFTTYTPLSATLVISGRPVFIGLNSDGSANGSLLGSQSASTSTSSFFYIVRDNSVVVGTYTLSASTSASGSAISVPSTCLQVIDFPTAGSHTYTIACAGGASGVTTSVYNSNLVIYEL